MTTADRQLNRARRLVLASWVVAAAVLIALAIAVIRFLSDSGNGGTGASAMTMHMSGALYHSASDSSLHEPLLGSALITAWQLDAVAVAILVVLAAGYLTAVSLAPLRSGERWPLRRTLSFLAGLAVCGFATCGSIAVYDQVLFSAHMLGHLALVMVAPVLLVSGRPLRLLMTAARPAGRERLQRIVTGRVVSLLTAPPIALAAYAVAIVGTHLTGLMDQIMQITWAGQLEHLVYLLIGCQFFALIVGDEPLRWRLSAPARWLLLAIAMAVDTFTGVILLQASSPIAMVNAPALRVDALSDTHTGGAIMWVGGDAIMALVMIVLVVNWLYRPAQRGADNDGWAERARRTTFEEHTGAAPASDIDDADGADAARRAYNEWLANLADR